MKRNRFLIALLSIPLLWSASAVAKPQGDGVIRLFNYHLNEFAEIRFRQGNRLLEEGLQKIYVLFRSRDSNAVRPINIDLIDLLDHIQDHFSADTIEIISGYRRKEFNLELRRNGHQVGLTSFHIKGMAADIHIDEIREETLRDYALSLKAGGVGYYGPFDFVHLDVGPIRHWGETGSSERKLIGVLQESAPLQLRSDKNDYMPGSTLHWHWIYPADFDPKRITDLQLEHFFRGEWQQIDSTPSYASKKSFTLPASAPLFSISETKRRYGKYRFTYRIKGSSELQSSNEFYLKKL